ncbi:hypothetical protein AB4Z25_24920 [Rhizobium sp. RAF36]|uniref:hypothetical protein n=1 Tax=Rhizobium sp. RAF36 TaxID=3233055 RepID=UPI003F952D8A
MTDYHFAELDVESYRLGMFREQFRRVSERGGRPVRPERSSFKRNHADTQWFHLCANASEKPPTESNAAEAYRRAILVAVSHGEASSPHIRRTMEFPDAITRLQLEECEAIRRQLDVRRQD